MNIIRRIQQASIYPFAYRITSLKSLLQRLKTFTKPTTVIYENNYKSEKVLLIALYEKGELRSDVLNLLQTSKKLGLYIMAVNTLKIKNPSIYKEVIDVYIERPNFGRDFGSYKTGFSYFFKNQYEKLCPRLLMLNDSLFYTSKGLSEFLENMTNTDVEVLGATENHEIEHHLGSFCISFKQNILKNKKFIKYWRNYTNSDVRPVVIKRGEMGLSKTLKRCVTKTKEFKAHYNLAYITDLFNRDISLVENISKYYRNPSFHRIGDTGWRRASIKGVHDRLKEFYIINDSDMNSTGNIETKIETDQINFLSSTKDLQNMLERRLPINQMDLAEKINKETLFDFIDCFTSGSQVHQNALFLLHIGLPFIKLDGLYRGMFSNADVEALALAIDTNESLYFKEVMYNNPFGGDRYIGWRAAAFNYGLI